MSNFKAASKNKNNCFREEVAMKKHKVVGTRLMFSLVVFALLVPAIAWGVDGRNVPGLTRELYRRYPNLRGTHPPPEDPERQERQEQERKSTEATDKGLECSKKGDYDCAIRHFKEALRLDSDNKAARDKLGSALNRKANKFYEQRDWNRAIKYYKEALEYKPNDKAIQDNLCGAQASAQEERMWKTREAERHRKFAEAKTKMNKMSDDLEKDFDNSKAPSTSAGPLSFSDAPSSDALEFAVPGESLFSKGSKSSAPVDLMFMEPGKPMVVDPRVVKGEMTPEEARKDRENEIMSGPGSFVNKEQDQYENRNKEWLCKQQGLIRQAVDSEKKRNKEMLSAISQARVPKLPQKSLNDLKPGDVILVKPSSVGSRAIPYGDVLSRWLHGSHKSQKYDISHSVVYLKTVKGKRLYLDHQKDVGFARIIDEDIFLKRYEKRLSYVARPKSLIDGKKLWSAARGAALKNNTPYGFSGKSVVCSELARFAVVQASGKRLPLDSTRLVGPDMMPSDFIDPETDGKYFVVTPLRK